jgi:hypothetical protein
VVADRRIAYLVASTAVARRTVVVVAAAAAVVAVVAHGIAHPAGLAPEVGTSYRHN